MQTMYKFLEASKQKRHVVFLVSELVGCSMNPCTRDLRFWPYENPQTEFPARAESFTRALCGTYSAIDGQTAGPSSSNGESAERVPIAP